MNYLNKIIYLLAAVIFIGCQAQSDMGPLLERKVLFGNPDKAGLKLSDDGSYVSYRAPVNGVMNIWIAPVGQFDQAKPVTADTLRGIRRYFWSYTNEHIIYLQDVGGDENWTVHVVDINTLEDKNLTPFSEIIGPDGKPVTTPSGKILRPRAQIQEVSHKFPNEILIGLNKRNPNYHDIYRLNILTGKIELIQVNDEFAGFNTDDNYNVRLAQKMTPDGGMVIYKPAKGGKWDTYLEIGSEDMMTTMIFGFDKSGENAYMIDSRGRNTAALKILNLKTDETEIIAEDPKSDIQNLIIHPEKKTIQAAASSYLRTKWMIIDDSIEADLDYLNSLVDGELIITSRTTDDKFWTVAFNVDNGPIPYYFYDKEKRKATFMFNNREAMSGLKMAKMHSVEIKSRDGLNLVSYLTLPAWTDADGDGRPQNAVPMVLFVHGGPWGRDSWGYNPYHQWLANRGYAVLSVNFRSSTGFGKDFINAGVHEWAGKMHDDLIDAVNWAIDNGIAQKEKIAIMGGSYGGYATLVGLTFTPDVFACGVDIVGPSNLNTLLATIPPYWKSIFNMFTRHIGDPGTEEGKKLLDDRSPLTYVDKINKPLLIGQGANDPRVKQSEADQIVEAMTEKNIPVVYVLFGDEGHGFRRPENSLSFNAVVDLFLAKHLGGRFQPIGEDFNGSSIQVPTGADQIPDLKKALE